MNRTSVLLADDHSILLDGLVGLLQQDFDVLGTAYDGRTLIEMAKAKRPDVIVTDISMPSLNGIDATRILHQEGCNAKIVLLTMHEDLPLLDEAFRAGASGFLLKICDAAEFINAIRSVAGGAKYITPLLAGDLVSSLMTVGPRGQSRDKPLTVRQRELLQLLAEGKTMKEAAAVMGISTRTAESHKYEIMRLLGVQNTAGLVRYAIRSNLI